MKNITGANLLAGGLFRGFFDVFFKEVEPIYEGNPHTGKKKPSETGNDNEAFAGYVERIGDKVVEMVVYKNRICRAVILAQDKPKGAPEPGVKGLSDFTAHLADRLGVPFNLGEAINFTHEELGSARRHHAAPPQRSGASAAVDPPGQPDPPPLQAPVQMAVQMAVQVVEQVAAPMPSPPAAPKPRPFSAPTPAIAPKPRPLRTPAHAMAPESEPRAHASSPTEATGQIVQAGMTQVLGRDDRPIEIFSISLQTEDGAVNFNGVDLAKKFSEGAFHIGDWVYVKKTVVDFTVQRNGVPEERTKNVYVVKILKSR